VRLTASGVECRAWATLLHGERQRSLAMIVGAADDVALLSASAKGANSAITSPNLAARNVFPGAYPVPYVSA